MSSLRADQVLLQRINRITVLRYIKREEPISRIDLSKRTGLSPSTITNITHYFLRKNLISERKSPATGAKGRRPVWLSLNPDGGRLIGVEIRKEVLRGAVTDLSGKVLSYKERNVQDPGDPQKLTAEARDLVGSLRTKLKRRPRLLGIGVSFPGVLDPETGDCLLWADAGWGRFPLKEGLEEGAEVPVLVDKDSRAEALGEFWFGAGQDVNDLVFLKLDSEVSAGVVSDGRPYRGSKGLAGEIGHITVDPKGKRCRCGKLGCLETKVSVPAALERAREVLKEHPGSSLAGQELSLRSLYRAAGEGDEAAGKVLEELAYFVRMALETVVYTYDSELVVLAGEMVEAEGAEVLLEKVKLGGFPLEVRIETSKLDEHRGVVGAASMVLHRLVVEED